MTRSSKSARKGLGVTIKRRSKKRRPADWYSGFESPPDVYKPRIDGVLGEPALSKV